MLVALLIYIEIAPNDIAAKCSTGLQQACLTHYVIAGGGYESALTDGNCGTSRV